MNRTDALYQPLDDFLKILKKKIKETFAPLYVSGFDQLNVISLSTRTEQMYNDLDKFNRKHYQELAEHAWKWAQEVAGKDIPKIDLEKMISEYLAGYDPVTQYVYNREIDRKRMRLNESILTAREYSDVVKLHKAVKKAADLWFTQSNQYALDLMDLALTRAFEEEDTKFFRWNAVIDGHECEICHERDGKIYDADTYPDKPHYGCRCYKTPAHNAVQ